MIKLQVWPGSQQRREPIALTVQTGKLKPQEGDLLTGHPRPRPNLHTKGSSKEEEQGSSS